MGDRVEEAVASVSEELSGPILRTHAEWSSDEIRPGDIGVQAKGMG